MPTRTAQCPSFVLVRGRSPRHGALILHAARDNCSPFSMPETASAANRRDNFERCASNIGSSTRVCEQPEVRCLREVDPLVLVNPRLGRTLEAGSGFALSFR